MTTTIGIGGYHYKHYAINMYFKTFVLSNYRRYNVRYGSIMKNHMVFYNAKGSWFIDSIQWHVQWHDTRKHINQFYKNGFPIVLLYARTWHKLQNDTISTDVVVDIHNAFALGLTYVMLSRLLNRTTGFWEDLWWLVIARYPPHIMLVI